MLPFATLELCEVIRDDDLWLFGFLLRNILFTGPHVAWQMLLMFWFCIFEVLYKFWILAPCPGYNW